MSDPDSGWNTAGRPVTYCATVASLPALEKRVHVGNPALLPSQAMVEYDIPDGLSTHRIEIGDLPADWARREVDTQQAGDAWLDSAAELLLIVPSVIVPIETAPDRSAITSTWTSRGLN